MWENYDLILQKDRKKGNERMKRLNLLCELKQTGDYVGLEFSFGYGCPREQFVQNMFHQLSNWDETYMGCNKNC